LISRRPRVRVASPPRRSGQSPAPWPRFGGLHHHRRFGGSPSTKHDRMALTLLVLVQEAAGRDVFHHPVTMRQLQASSSAGWGRFTPGSEGQRFWLGNGYRAGGRRVSPTLGSRPAKLTRRHLAPPPRLIATAVAQLIPAIPRPRAGFAPLRPSIGSEQLLLVSEEFSVPLPVRVREAGQAAQSGHSLQFDPDALQFLVCVVRRSASPHDNLLSPSEESSAPGRSVLRQW
jgi:hypothetical protein